MPYGSITHPTLGTYAYEEPPDEWVNVDADIIIPPTWTSTKTLTSSANVLWLGNIRDVTVEERWKQELAMPISQLRMLLSIWTSPVDPTTGIYVTWSPSYINQNSYNVLPMKLSVGGSDNFVFDDVVNNVDGEGSEDGWVTNPVTLTLKIISKVGADTTTTTPPGGVVASPLALSPYGLPNGNVGTPYSQQMVATGGTPPYTFSIYASSLPPELTLNASTGVFSGTVTAPITLAFTITVKDSVGGAVTLAYSVVFSSGTIGQEILVLSPAVAPEATVGKPYSLTMTASGGVPPYTWYATDTMPPGCKFDVTTATLTFPAFDSTYRSSIIWVHITATDSVGNTGVSFYDIQVQ